MEICQGTLKTEKVSKIRGWNLKIEFRGCSTTQHPDIISIARIINASLGDAQSKVAQLRPGCPCNQKKSANFWITCINGSLTCRKNNDHWIKQWIQPILKSKANKAKETVMPYNWLLQHNGDHGQEDQQHCDHQSPCWRLSMKNKESPLGRWTLQVLHWEWPPNIACRTS